MIKLFTNLQEQTDLRQTLSNIRKEIKDENQYGEFIKLIEGNEGILQSLLGHEDAKVRKNAALLMGDLGFAVFLKPLMEAYEREEQLFVKSSYLKALKGMDYQEYLPVLKKRLEELIHTEITEENKKHIDEEVRELSGLVVYEEGITTHTFTGYHKKSEVILLTNRNHIHVTTEKLTGQDIKEMSAGVRFVTEDIQALLDIRTYSEMMFLVPDMKSCDMDPVSAAVKIADSGFVSYLEERHKEKAPFYFRVEIKSKLELDKKSAFCKKFATELERRTNRQLINSASNYEIEIRLVQNREGKCNIMVKLYTIPDNRFTYRKESIPTSIKPVNAALLTELALPYMKEKARVLDPFCGVGTMLIERQKKIKADTMYGVDYNGIAIEKGRINAQEAGQIIHFVNKNCFDFEHEYLFDEVFTNMPFVTAGKSEEDIRDTYVRFFKNISSLLTDDAVIIMYTHNIEYVREFALKNGFRIKQQFRIMDKEGTDLVILDNLSAYSGKW